MVHLARAGHRREPPVPLPGYGGPRVAPLPRDPRRRARHPGARGRRPARDHRALRAPAAVRLGDPRHHRRAHAGAHPRHPQREPRAGRAGHLHGQVAPRPQQPLGPPAHRPPRPVVSASGAVHAGGAGRRRGGRHLRRHPPAGHPAAPPLRLVRPGRGLRELRRRRPRRAGHQDHALPRGPQRAGRRRADGGRRQRQAGGRPPRAQGALRRREQHRLGQGPRARGRARGVRARRPQDALQDHARRAPRRRPYPPLRASRHRQLQQRHHEAVHRPRLSHLRRRSRRRRLRGVQPAHRLRHERRLPQVSGGARHDAPRYRGAHRPRDRACAAWGRGAPDLQDELAGRQAADPQPLSGVAGGRQGRAQRARHVLPAARRPRRERQHQRTQHRRPFPRAQPHLLVP